MTTVLVTGAGGYIGQRLTERLLLDGHIVRAQVRTPLPWPPGVEEVVGDLVTDPTFARQIAQNIDVVVHLAGANEVSMAEHPETAYAQTVVAAERVAASGVQRAVYLSTVHVYGDSLRPGALIDEGSPTSPTHPYATARLACEGVFESSAVPTVSFRVTNGVGAPMRPETPRWSLVANELCREGVTKGRVTLRTSGVQWRDFIPLRDVEQAVSRLLGRPSFPAGIFNLGSGTSFTIRGLAALVQDSIEGFGQPRPELSAPLPPSNAPGPYRVDIGALERLGLAGHTPLRTAIDETVRFCLDHRASLS
jgi:UDP-glucose 4-epimerase